MRGEEKVGSGEQDSEEGVSFDFSYSLDIPIDNRISSLSEYRAAVLSVWAAATGWKRLTTDPPHGVRGNDRAPEDQPLSAADVSQSPGIAGF